jgi:hypothetical protein
MKSWFKIVAKAKGAAEILIYDEIGFFGITALARKAGFNAQEINARYGKAPLRR